MNTNSITFVFSSIVGMLISGSSGAFKRYATPASYSLRIKTPSDVIIGSFIGCVLQCHKNPHCIMMSFTNSNPVRCTLSEWALLENQSDAHTGSQLYEVVERNRLLNVGFSKQLARNKPTSQIGTSDNYNAAYAVDGIYCGSLQHTINDRNAWWRVDLEMTHYICGVRVWNRHHEPHRNVNARFHHIRFEVSQTIDELQFESSLCAEQVEALPAGAVHYYPCIQGGVLSIDRSKLYMAGRFVQLRKYNHPVNEESYIHLHEVEVHGY